MVGRHGHQLLAHRRLPATELTPPWDANHLQSAGPGVPRSAPRSARCARFPTNEETQVLHRGSGQSSGHYTPPARGRGRGTGYVTFGGRGGRTAGGSGHATRSGAGQHANHSHVTCPSNTCCRCGQSGHIQRFLPQLRKIPVR